MTSKIIMRANPLSVSSDRLRFLMKSSLDLCQPEVKGIMLFVEGTKLESFVLGPIVNEP